MDLEIDLDCGYARNGLREDSGFWSMARSGNGQGRGAI